MDLARIKERIRAFAASPRNVRFDDIDNFIRNQLVARFGGGARSNGSHYTYTVADRTFGITRRSDQIKQCYVRGFLEAMAALGLYEPESEE
jgi:hypothetical protein